MICARKSVLLKWVKDQEERHAGENRRQAQDRGKNVIENITYGKL